MYQKQDLDVLGKVYRLYQCGTASFVKTDLSPEAWEVGLYLGVWARVKRRRCRLMLRFTRSFLKSSGEFRGDPRGESLGETFGDPAAEPDLDRGRSWMMGSRVILRSRGESSASDCSSSELSEHRSLMAKGLVLQSRHGSWIGFEPSWLALYQRVVRLFLWPFKLLTSCFQVKLTPHARSLFLHIQTKLEPAHDSSKTLQETFKNSQHGN